MELSLLSPKPSPSPPTAPHLFSPLKPYPLLRPRPRPRSPNRSRCRRISLRCSAVAPGEAVFGGRKELTGVQPLAEALPRAARIAAELALGAAAIAAGYRIGQRVGGGSLPVAIGGATVLGVASIAAAFALNSVVPEVAAVGLHNYVASCDDLAALERGDVEAIARKYGVSKQDKAFNAELCALYSRFVESVLPPGGEELNGSEVEAIVKFKSALGLDDIDAASMHMEIGRRIYRDRLEVGDLEADMEQRRAFKKLIYVSNLVFGDASAFLLPWKRLFGVTDSQVDIAIRDNAKSLYALKLKSIGRDMGTDQLIDLRRSQVVYKLSDEIAAEMFREHARKLIEEKITSVLDILKSRAKAVNDMTQVVEELKNVLAFNDLLTTLSKHPEADQFARGVGPVSLLGGEYDNDIKIGDLKLLYRVYATELFSDGRFDDKKLAPLNHLRNIFGLGKREAEAILADIKSAMYRKRLAKSFNTELAAAPSKAAFLQNLCEDLRLDPEVASKMHEDIYRQKLQQFVADGDLSKEEVEALMAFQVRLCIPQETVDAVHADVCGRMFEKVVKEAISSVDGYNAERQETVKKAVQGLNLKKEAAMAIFSKAVRKMFLNYIERAKSAGNRIETAKELRKLVSFNAVVVTELLAGIKGEPATVTAEPETQATTTAAQSETTESEQEDEGYAWESLETIRKTRPDKAVEGNLAKPVQTEITLKDDLPLRDRANLYETYLLFCITGETTSVSFGVTITSKKDNSEYLMLKQLGDILGLTNKEVVGVHIKLAEKAFLQQAEGILADGKLTEAKADQLAKIQKQVGLPTEHAQKIIKNITTEKLSAAVEASITRGQVGIKQVRGFKEAKFPLESLISEPLRESIFRKTVEEIFSSGTGEFDEVEVYERIPAELIIDAEKAKSTVQDIAKIRLGNSLVQAIALLRQRNRDGVLSSLNDMLACDAAVAATNPLSWSTPRELDELYSIYMKSIPKPEKLSRLQFLLGVSDEKASLLQDAATEGALPVTTEEEEKLAF